MLRSTSWWPDEAGRFPGSVPAYAATDARGFRRPDRGAASCRRYRRAMPSLADYPREQR